MLQNYLKTAWRNIIRFKGYSFINVLGLALGMACCLMISFWVQDELGFDRFHRNGRHIFRVVSDWAKNDWKGIEGTPPPLGPAVKAQLPAVKQAARLYPAGRKVFRYREKSFYEDRGIIVDPQFFAIFSFPFRKGSWQTAFSGPDAIVITATMAARYFGDEDPLGKTILVEGQPRVVRGVLQPVPRQSTLQFDYALPTGPGQSNPGWGAFIASTCLLLEDGADVSAAGQLITRIASRNGCPQVQDGASFRLQPLAEIHLDGRAYQQAVVNLGDSRYVYLFSVIAVLVLLVACINFMNLSLARARLRAREVGLRRVAGAGRGALAGQFFCESQVLVLVAAVIAMLLVWLLIPAFNQLSGKSLSLSLFRFEYLASLTAVILVTGFLAGAYPALILSGFRPAKALKGDIQSAGKDGAFRKILVVVQFSLSIVLLISAVAVISQFRFMRNTKPGYNKDNVVLLPVKEIAGKSYTAMKERWLLNPAVLAVTVQEYPFAETGYRSSGNWDWEGRLPGQELDMVYRGVEYGFFEAMDIALAAGRSFAKEYPGDCRGAVILNETAVRAMKIKDPAGRWFSLSKDDRRTIIGIARDVRYQTFHFKVEPEVYYLANPATEMSMGVIMIRIDGKNSPAALGHIQRVWEEFNTVSPFEYRFLDETYGRLYRDDLRMSWVFAIFSGLTVFIACLGLLGLALFMTGRRKREIGVRKVLGATTPGIVIMITRQLTKWVLAANLVAWPASYYALNKLFQGYVYRISPGWEIYLLPSLAVFLLVTGTVALQSLGTARTNPAGVLRNE